MPENLDPLFPELPEDITALSDQDLTELLGSHEEAAKLIDADDQEFLGALTADQIIEQYKIGAEQILALRAEQSARAEAHQNFQAAKAEVAAQIKAEDEPAPDDPSDPEDEEKTEEAEEKAEPIVAEETVEEETEEIVVEEEKVLVTASVTPRLSRRPPTPSPERTPVPAQEEKGAALVASAQFKADHPGSLDPDSLASLVREVALDLGGVEHNGKLVQRMRVEPWQIDHYPDGRRVEIGGGEIQWDGPKTKVARAEYQFPEERTLNGSDDMEKIRAALPKNVTFMGKPGTFEGIEGHENALVASGGLCAPLTPIYSMPNFATEAEPVWDSLPVFRAARGGVNVPTATDISDISTAISSISEANDALGGTFATKTCQDLTCPEYTETAVNIFAHCREFGNLNARAWPEKIAHENALTMAALSRTSETFMLDRIKALSINVTQAAIGTQYGSFASLVHAIAKASAGIKFRLRMPRETNFRVLLPSWIPDHLAADNAAQAFDRYLAQSELERRLSAYRITVTYYLDNVTGGTSQGFAAEAAGALDEFPDDVQYAIYAEGTFLGIDSGTLELGIVRDSTLNSTNDFQIFGERFRNLARLGPAQAALWVTQDICPTGSSAAAATALTC